MLEHGGNLQQAQLQYGSPHAPWLDLSTGINPYPYPAPVLSHTVWHRLPEISNSLISSACAYYGAPDILPVAGTQAAIQALPQLWCNRPLDEYGQGRQTQRIARVVVAAPAYAEHAYRWQRAGHLVREVTYADLATAIVDCDVMVICNPNNPTGDRIVPEILLDWAERMAKHGGWLIVDEAFCDVTPELSIAAHSHMPGLLVLRSFGKFFGLAGLRLGFVAAHRTILDVLAEHLGPWSVSAPAQEIGVAALTDHTWQQTMRDHLHTQGARLQAMLAAVGVHSTGSTLYQWWPQSHAQAFHAAMAKQGIWVRLFTRDGGSIRVGLPADAQSWQRLEAALPGALAASVSSGEDQ